MQLHLLVSANYNPFSGLRPTIEVGPIGIAEPAEVALFKHCCPGHHLVMPVDVFDANETPMLLRNHGVDSVSVIFMRDQNNRCAPEDVKQRVLKCLSGHFIFIESANAPEQSTPPKGTPDETPDCVKESLAPQR